MRTKLTYPKIPDSSAKFSGRCIAFNKYDGTNLHWNWEPELGWYGFGARRTQFDLDDQGIAEFNAHHKGLLSEAPDIFRRDLADPLE